MVYRARAPERRSPADVRALFLFLPIRAPYMPVFFAERKLRERRVCCVGIEILIVRARPRRLGCWIE